MEITWLHDGQEIQEENGATFNSNKRTSALTIESVAAYNAGNYTCLAKNSAGVDKYTIELIVNGSLGISISIVIFEFV